MNSGLWSKGQPLLAPLGGQDFTYWVKGQPNPGVSSITIVSGGEATANATATMTASGVVVKRSSTTLTATAAWTRAVGERIPANALNITTPNATIFARGTFNYRGRTNIIQAQAVTLFRGRTVKGGVANLSAPATIQATPRTNSQTSTLLESAATITATPHWITRTSTTLSARALLTGTRGSRLAKAVANVLAGTATINATPAAATGVRITHQTRALLQARQTQTHTASSRLFYLHTQTQTTAALLKATQTRTQTTAGRLFYLHTQTHSTAGRLWKLGTKTHGTAARLKLIVSKTQATDALLWAEQTIDHTLDALLWKQQRQSHATVATLIPEKAEQHHTTARLYSLVSLPHGTNARLLMEFIGSGAVTFPSLQVVTGQGLLNHYFPKKSELILPKLQLRGKGEFIRPEFALENLSDVYYRNRRYLEWAYCWGKLDHSQPLLFQPCRYAKDFEEEVTPQTLAIDPAYLKWEKERSLRAALLAQKRREARLSDPNYREPVWGLPEPKESQEEAIPEAPSRPYSVEPVRVHDAPTPGKVRLLPTVVRPEPIVEYVCPPQPIVVPAEPEKVISAEVVHPRVGFHVEPPRAKVEREAGEVLIVAAGPSLVAAETRQPEFVPPQPVVKIVDRPVAVLEPPPAVARGRGFSVGPRTRKRKH